jgi:hypothetical protein
MEYGHYLTPHHLLVKKVTLGLIRIQAEFLFIMMDTGSRLAQRQSDLLVLKDCPALLVHKVTKETQVPQEIRVQLEQQVLQVRLEMAEAEVWLTHGG